MDRTGCSAIVEETYFDFHQQWCCYVGRWAMVMKVQGRWKRGRPKIRWLDKVKDDIKENGLSADDVYYRATWRRMSSYIDPT